MSEVIVSTHGYRELPREWRPQDPNGDGAGWMFTTLEHGGDYPDAMPNVIRGTDPQGRSCIYLAVNVDGRVVGSIGFELSHEVETMDPRPAETASGTRQSGARYR